MKNLNLITLSTIVGIILFISSNSVTAQTGPGGVGNTTTNPAWLDAHALGFPDGAPIANWTDQSGNGNNFTQAASIKYPTYVSSGISGLPSLSFDGENDVIRSGAIPSLDSPNITYFLVYQNNDLSKNMLINAAYSSNAEKWKIYSNLGSNLLISAQYSPAIRWVRYPSPVGVGSFMSSHIIPSSIKVYNQGNLMMTRTAPYTTPTGHQKVLLGRRNEFIANPYIYDGLMSEVIIYNTALNNLERILVENYIGAKYQLSIPTDLYSHETTHRFGLIGIGNDGTDAQTSAQGAGELSVSGATDLSSGEYWLAAHTDFSFTTYNTDNLPVSLPEHQRLERVWRLDETGDVGVTTLTYHLGSGDFAVPESYRLLVDTDGDFSDATVIAGVYDAGSSTVTFTTNLADNSYFTLSGIQEILYIHSITDGVWSDPSTWDCDCVPAANDYVYIEPATTVTVDVDAYVDFLQIIFDGTLIMDTDVTLNVYGDFVITGTCDFTAGSLELPGVVEQNITISASIYTEANFFNINLENTNPGNVTFDSGPGAFLLNGTLFPNRGNMVISAGSKFIITSTSETTGGRVAPIIAPTTLNGNFSVQRNIPVGLADYRNLASPVIGATFNDWDPDLAMSGPDFPDGCAYGDDGCFISVLYHEHDDYFDVTSSSTEILNGRGFEIFVGSDLETFSGTTLTSTGTLNTYADMPKTLTAGWWILGNPYASPITYNSIEKTSQISKYYYVYDASTGAYQWYDQVSETSSIPSITGDGLISSGQGVWVKCTTVGTLTYKQSDKSNGNATFIRTAGVEDQSLVIKLKENASTYSCSIALEELDGATDGSDSLFDIHQLITGKEKAPSFAISKNGDLLRKNYLSPDGKNKHFDLDVVFKNEGYYTLSVTNFANFRDYEKILLFDRVSGESINLKNQDYVFYADDATMKGSRFSLTLTNDTNVKEGNSTIVNDLISNEISIKQIGNQIDIQAYDELNEKSFISLTNVLGQTVDFETTIQLVNGSNLLTLPANLKGFYIISVRTGTSITTKKVVL